MMAFEIQEFITCDHLIIFDVLETNLLLEDLEIIDDTLDLSNTFIALATTFKLKEFLVLLLDLSNVVLETVLLILLHCLHPLFILSAPVSEVSFVSLFANHSDS